MHFQRSRTTHITSVATIQLAQVSAASVVQFTELVITVSFYDDLVLHFVLDYNRDR
jgi:hypothetical protein